MEGYDVVTLFQQALIDGLESADRGLGSGRQAGAGGQPLVELIRGQVDAVPVVDIVDDHIAGDDADVQFLDQVGGEVGGAVGNDADGHIRLLHGGKIGIMGLPAIHQVHLDAGRLFLDLTGNEFGLLRGRVNAPVEGYDMVVGNANAGQGGQKGGLRGVLNYG